jgi:hypothetical protein
MNKSLRLEADDFTSIHCARNVPWCFDGFLVISYANFALLFFSPNANPMEAPKRMLLLVSTAHATCLGALIDSSSCIFK